MGWFKESKRHGMARRGIKTKPIILSTAKRNSVNSKLTPLLRSGKIKSYNYVDDFSISKDKRYKMFYGQESERHKKAIIRELDSQGIKYKIIPKEEMTLKSGRFDIDNEYYIVMDLDKQQLDDIELFLNRKAVDRNEFDNLMRMSMNPTYSYADLFILPDSEKNPEIFIIGEKGRISFKKGGLISKRLDKNTHLLINDFDSKTKRQIKDKFKDERVRRVLIQDYI